MSTLLDQWEHEMWVNLWFEEEWQGPLRLCHPGFRDFFDPLAVFGQKCLV